MSLFFFFFFLYTIFRNESKLNPIQILLLLSIPRFEIQQSIQKISLLYVNIRKLLLIIKIPSFQQIS